MQQNTKSKHTISIIAGHLFEHYDICLYGFFAVLLAPVFFPATSVLSSQIASFGAFAAGFLMRPVGGFIFGYVGDHYGRKRALLLSIALAILPTLFIGLLPTYESIGILAPILLVLFRLAQGISVGGEYCGAIIYFFEHSRQLRPALKAGFLIGSGFAGAVLGTLVGTLCTAPFMPTWGWRIPFIMGGLMGIIIYWMRLGIQETPDFKAISDLNRPSGHPLKHVISKHKREFLCCIVFGGGSLVPLYLATIYMNVWLIELGLVRSQILLNNTIIMICSGVMMPVAGFLADRLGVLKVMNFTLYSAVLLTFPLYYFLTAAPSYSAYIILQVYLAIVNASVMAPLASFLPTLFPSTHRYSGLTVSYTIGQAALGGSTPILATLLTNYIGQKWAPSLLLSGSSLIFLVCLKACLRSRLVNESNTPMNLDRISKVAKFNS